MFGIRNERLERGGINMDLLERAKILLKATKDLLEKQENSCYVLNLLTETVFYDGVDCDGTCLKDDIGYWFDELEDESPTKTISLDKVEKAREKMENRLYKQPQTTSGAWQNVGVNICLEILDELISEREG